METKQDGRINLISGNWDPEWPNMKILNAETPKGSCIIKFEFMHMHLCYRTEQILSISVTLFSLLRARQSKSDCLIDTKNLDDT